MVFRKKDQLVGLDIGSSRIKVALLQQNAKGYELIKLGMAPVPAGLITEGRIMDPDAVAEIIRNLFRDHRIKNKNVAISTGGYSVVIKTIVVPTASEKELVTSIRTEAEQYIPYDIDDVNIDFQILGTSDFSDDQMNVLLVAVKKDLVAEYIDMINQAGLNPCIIDVDSFALQNIYEATYQPEEDQVVLLVDVGFSKISLNILRGSQSLMMRDTASGIAQIHEEIMNELECSPEKAAEVLNGNAEGMLAAARWNDICFGAVQNWCSEIQAIVKSFLNKTNEDDLERILVAGGGCLVPGFLDMLSTELAATVSPMDPFQGVDTDKHKFSASQLSGIRSHAPIAMGLALRRMDDK